jgi:hypothetical protein
MQGMWSRTIPLLNGCVPGASLAKLNRRDFRNAGGLAQDVTTDVEIDEERFDPLR